MIYLLKYSPTYK